MFTLLAVAATAITKATVVTIAKKVAISYAVSKTVDVIRKSKEK